MGSAWDNVTQLFADAKEKRQSTTFGERLGEGLRKTGIIDTPANATPEDSPILADTAWGGIIDTYKQTPPFNPEDSARAQPRGQSTRGPVSEEDVIDGLVERGMPIHVATAFAWNMKDESNLNPGINEISPLVKGSRGGFGLNQWTGPRRRQLEAFASKRGVDVSDFDMQLDFLMHELETTEKAAKSSIYGAGTTGQAADAIVRKFLRPHESHRERRSANYLSRDAGGYTPVPSRTPIRSWNDLL